MTLHVAALANMPLLTERSCCAYTQKVVKFARMMTDFGEHVTCYHAGPSDVPDSVCVLPEADRVEHFGEEGRPDFDTRNPGWQQFNWNTVRQLEVRWEPGDLLCVIGGQAHKPISDALPALPVVEFGIGYEATFAPYRVFESHAWRHVIYGMQQGAYQADGRWYDEVIPNYFDRHDFDPTIPKRDFALYLGRMVDRKGVHVAQQAAEAAGIDLILAGAGDAKVSYGTHIGPVGPVERRELLGQARCLIAPTLYVEPFGGVVVEAHLSGTPTLTTDWGAFTETVQNGVNGWRCHTLAGFVGGIKSADRLPRDRIVATAEPYTLERIGPRYIDYFDRVLAVINGDGWYEPSPVKLYVSN